MRSIFTKATGKLLGVITLGVVLMAPTAISAAEPPVNRTYFVVAVGLAGAYDLKAKCFSFTSAGLCSLDGEICGTWQPLESDEGQSSFGFELFALDEGRRVVLEGVGRTDGRGRKSAIAGAGRVSGIGPTANFAFSGRRANVNTCLSLLADFGEDDRGVIRGSGVVTTETRSVQGFSGVALGGVGKLFIDHSGSESLTITAEENILPLLRSEVVGDRLLLGPAPGTSISNSKQIIYRLTAANLDELVVSGVTTVNVKRLDTRLFTLNLSGVSTVKASGRVDRQEITVSGTAIYKARNLTSRIALVDISGLGQAVLRVSEQLGGSVSGFGVLEYLGNPLVDLDVSEFGDVRDIGD